MTLYHFAFSATVDVVRISSVIIIKHYYMLMFEAIIYMYIYPGLVLHSDIHTMQARS